MFSIGEWRRTRSSLLGVGLLSATALLVTPPSQAVEGGLPQLESAVESSSAQNDSDKGKSLYERLGGYDAISAVAEDFAWKLFEDPRIAQYFRGMGDDTKQQFIQKNKNLLCNATGGPCKIISRPAKVVHGGLGITEKEFNIVVEHLVQTLDKFKVPPAEKSELLEIIGSLKPDIVEEN